MAAAADYRALVQGLSSLDFSGSSIPCKLLLTGDSAFPVLVTPAGDVLIAASRYGKGRVVIVAHESYLNSPQFLDFLLNAVSWLSPAQGAVIGVHRSLDLLAQTLSAAGCTVQGPSDLTQGLRVLCTSGYDDSNARKVVSFLREGGGLLIGAQAWHWSYSHKHDNVLHHFPGNKITAVSGVYFTDSYGEKGVFNVSVDMPRSPIYTQHTVDHSADLKHLLQGVSYLDISGRSVPSELLVHGALAFPVGLSDSNQCFLAAAHYGNGRVVVGAHEGHLSSPQLKAFILNAMSWLDQGRNGMIGIHKNLRDLSHVLQKGSVSREVSNLVSGLSVYCCNSYSDHEAEVIQQFVAEGGGLLIAGHAWYWSYQNPDCEVLTHYPGNRILNKFGVSILDRTVPQGNYKVPDPEGAENYYLFRRALCQLQSDLQSGADSKPPLRSWMQKLRQDSCTFLRLQGQDFPLVSSLQKEFVEMVKTYGIPNICQEGPVCGKSKEALFLCLAHEVHSLSLDCELGNDDPYLHDKSSVTVQIDATNPGGEAWRSTGLYLPPGRTATLVFPAWAVGKDLQVQVGCHSDNLSSAEQLCRAPVVVRRWCILGERTLVSCVWGGLLYIIVRAESQLGNVPLIVYGAEQSPTYIQGETCLTSWLETIRHFPSPWAELITENIILTVPSDTIRSLEDPHDLLSLWDKIMIAVTELAMIPPKFPRPERIVTDVQISAGWMHAGYPIMCHLQSVCHLTDLQHMQRVGLWGFIHELGHNEQRKCWEFPPHTTEATCNLWSVYVHETVLGIPRDQAHSELQPKNRDFRILQFLQNGADLQQWHVWTALETYLQLQEGFGWDPLKRLFSEYQTMSDIKDENTYKMNLWVEKFSHAVQRNLAPFFQAWGWPMQGETCSKVSTFPEWEEDPMRSYLRAMTA